MGFVKLLNGALRAILLLGAADAWSGPSTSQAMKYDGITRPLKVVPVFSICEPANGIEGRIE
jgi:hypothetical protein